MDGQDSGRGLCISAADRKCRSPPTPAHQCPAAPAWSCPPRSPKRQSCLQLTVRDLWEPGYRSATGSRLVDPGYQLGRPAAAGGGQEPAARTPGLGRVTESKRQRHRMSCGNPQLTVVLAAPLGGCKQTKYEPPHSDTATPRGRHRCGKSHLATSSARLCGTRPSSNFTWAQVAFEGFLRTKLYLGV